MGKSPNSRMYFRQLQTRWSGVRTEGELRRMVRVPVLREQTSAYSLRLYCSRDLHLCLFPTPSFHLGILSHPWCPLSWITLLVLFPHIVGQLWQSCTANTNTFTINTSKLLHSTYGQASQVLRIGCDI